MKIFFIFLTPLLFCSHALSKKIVYEVSGKKYEGYLLKKSKSAPLVLLVHDWDGLTDYEVKRANILLKLGYSVLAIDLFGQGVRPTKNKDKRQHTGELYKNRKKLRTLLSASLKVAEEGGLNTKNAVAMGYCFGGAAVLEWARSGENLKGFATFHGGLMTPKGQNYQKTQGKIMVFHGTSDTHITMEHFAQLANELDSTKISNEMISYGGAPHAFTVFGSKSYRKGADQKSWSRFQAFLKEVTH